MSITQQERVECKRALMRLSHRKLSGEEPADIVTLLSIPYALAQELLTELACDGLLLKEKDDDNSAKDGR